jgi:hypothetical protein
MKESKANFTLSPHGHGHYLCTYASPNTGKQWKRVISDMGLIDDVKHVDYPTQAALNRLKAAIKR